MAALARGAAALSRTPWRPARVADRRGQRRGVTGKFGVGQSLSLWRDKLDKTRLRSFMSEEAASQNLQHVRSIWERYF